MKLFLSWSGSQSKVVAEALSQFLVDAIHDLRPWISSKSIDPGKRWSDVLEKELKDTSYAILCVTNSNINAPWLNFEAGAISSGFSGVMICHGPRSSITRVAARPPFSTSMIFFGSTPAFAPSTSASLIAW